MNKYHAIPTVYRGTVYASKGEAAFAAHLDAMKAAGAIDDWAPHPSFVLLDAVGRKKRDAIRGEITFTPDYKVWPSPDGAPYCVLDFKSRPTMTRDFKLRAAVFVRVHPGVPLYVVGADGEEWRKL